MQHLCNVHNFNPPPHVIHKVFHEVSHLTNFIALYLEINITSHSMLLPVHQRRSCTEQRQWPRRVWQEKGTDTLTSTYPSTPTHTYPHTHSLRLLHTWRRRGWEISPASQPVKQGVCLLSALIVAQLLTHITQLDFTDTTKMQTNVDAVSAQAADENMNRTVAVLLKMNLSQEKLSEGISLAVEEANAAKRRLHGS